MLVQKLQEEISNVKPPSVLILVWLQLFLWLLNSLPRGRICLIATSEENLLMMSANSCWEDSWACPRHLSRLPDLPQLISFLIMFVKEIAQVPLGFSGIPVPWLQGRLKALRWDLKKGKEKWWLTLLPSFLRRRCPPLLLLERSESGLGTLLSLVILSVRALRHLLTVPLSCENRLSDWQSGKPSGTSGRELCGVESKHLATSSFPSVTCQKLASCTKQLSSFH